MAARDSVGWIARGPHVTPKKLLPSLSVCMVLLYGSRRSSTLLFMILGAELLLAQGSGYVTNIATQRSWSADLVEAFCRYRCTDFAHNSGIDLGSSSIAVLSDFQMTVRGACQTSEKRDRKRSEERTGLNSTGEKQKFITSIINHKYMILFGDVTWWWMISF